MRRERPARKAALGHLSFKRRVKSSKKKDEEQEEEGVRDGRRKKEGYGVGRGEKEGREKGKRKRLCFWISQMIWSNIVIEFELC